MLTYLIYCISYICATIGNHRKLNGQSLTHRKARRRRAGMSEGLRPDEIPW